MIEVADQGCGVPEFYETKYLSRVSVRVLTSPVNWHWVVLDCQLRNALRWCYHSEDNDPCGTLFSIYIPKVKPMTAPLTLLIVEDETPLAEMHRNIFVTFPDSARYYWRETWRGPNDDRAF